jgi:hypothetical protein
VHVSPVSPDGVVNVKRTGCVAKLAEQGFQFVGAAVDVADDVERAVLVALVVP